MDDLISRQAAIDALGDMVMNWTDSDYELGQLNQWKADRKAIIDLPSAQPIDIQDILEYLDTVLHPIVSPEHWDIYSELYDMISALPSAQPQLDTCPIYGGMCGYPSNLCYECPRHEGAKERPQWWTEGLQPFAQPKWIPVTERLPEDSDYHDLWETPDGAVLWCKETGEIGIGWYYASTKNWCDLWDNSVRDVVAWMPLPEPYAERREDA